MTTASLGKWGEEQAVNYLKRNGYIIIERNYATKIGELDIVARRKKKWLRPAPPLTFVEVKTSKRHHGTDSLTPEENVHKHKQVKLIQMAKIYLREKRIPLNSGWQIDVLAVEIDPASYKITMRHTEQAVADADYCRY